jgi:hypothetical protein
VIDPILYWDDELLRATGAHDIVWSEQGLARWHGYRDSPAKCFGSSRPASGGTTSSMPAKWSTRSNTGCVRKRDRNGDARQADGGGHQMSMPSARPFCLPKPRPVRRDFLLQVFWKQPSRFPQ